MENTLNLKKQKILKRLENTIESANTILYEINQDLESIIERNNVLATASDIYDIWVSKE